MSDKKLTIDDIEVPEGMIECAIGAVDYLWIKAPSAWNPSQNKQSIAKAAVSAALLYLAEHPIVPSDSQRLLMAEDFNKSGVICAVDYYSVEWQRRMFLKREPKIPEEVKELLVYGSDLQINQHSDNIREVNARITKAYELGKKEGSR